MRDCGVTVSLDASAEIPAMVVNLDSGTNTPMSNPWRCGLGVKNSKRLMGLTQYPDMPSALCQTAQDISSDSSH